MYSAGRELSSGFVDRTVVYRSLGRARDAGEE
jgi:hypothetical protein